MTATPLADTERVVERLSGVEERLARVEFRLEHAATSEDLARVGARLEHMATREDLTSFEARILRWLISFLAFGSISLLVGVTRTFLA